MILTFGPLLIGTSIGISSYIKVMFEQSETLFARCEIAQFTPFLFHMVYFHIDLYHRAK